jgi:sulfite reductase (NADPH) flavoprotein alpha-component
VDLPFAVLALGDRSYPQFCAFGLSVAGQLQQAGAKPLFPPVQVNQADPAMVNYWYQCLDKAH